jgi:predicted metal-dependent peptidase
MKITPIELSADDKRKWIETRSALQWTAPAFTHLLFSMLNPSRGELAALFTEDVPIAATDGNNLILNPKAFFKFNLGERMFIIAHEVMHYVFNHCGLSVPFRQSKKVKFADGTELPYDDQLMNVAMDLVINDLLIESKIGTFPKEGCHDTKIATHKDSFLDAYKKVFKQQQQGGGGGGGGNPPGGGKGFDQLLAPGTMQGKSAEQAVQDRSDTAWATAVAAAIAVAKARGKLPAALERMFSDILEPEVSWQDMIRAFFARKVGAGGYDWRKPDRRLIQRDIYAPQRSGNGCGDVVVAVDTSGSIGQRELDVFFGEMRGILDDVRPNRLFLVWCDAKVHHVDELDQTSDLTGLKPHGGGGTDFRPVFEWIDDNNVTPDALVYLTDGMGYFPSDEPRYPVVWGSIYEASKYPFGDVVNIPLKK